MLVKKSLEKYLEDFRKKHIPKEYNQLEFLNGLYDPKCACMISISNRRDGKTYNTINFLIHLALDYELRTVILVPHDFIRFSMVEQIKDVLRKEKEFKIGNFTMVRSTEFIRCFYGDNELFMITNLDNATDLKNFSGLMQDYSLTWYDEFLAVDGVYEPNSFEYFETIFQTMDRGDRTLLKPLNGMRKAIFTGNPVDFGSPFLAKWDLYEVLSKTKLNTLKKYKFFYIELRRNDYANKFAIKNPMFSSSSESFTGRFQYNGFGIKKNHKGTSYKIKIPKVLSGGCIVVYPQTKSIGYTPDEKGYSYALSLEDVTKDSIYVGSPKFQKDDFYKKYDQKRGKSDYVFDNAYIKNLVLENFPTLNIDKLSKLFMRKSQTNVRTSDNELKEKHNDWLKEKILSNFLL